MTRQMKQPRKDTLRENLARAADRMEALAAENAALRAQLALRRPGIVERFNRWLRR